MPALPRQYKPRKYSNTGRKTLTLYVPEEERDFLDRQAAAGAMPRNSYVRTLIQAAMKRATRTK